MLRPAFSGHSNLPKLVSCVSQCSTEWSAEILWAGVYIHPWVPGPAWGGRARLDWCQHFALGSIVLLCEPQGGERTVIESKTKSERSRAAYVSVEYLYIGVKGRGCRQPLHLLSDGLK